MDQLTVMMCGMSSPCSSKSIGVISVPRHVFRVAMNPRDAKRDHFNNDGSLKFEFRVCQFPVVPGWAVSIHKAQVRLCACVVHVCPASLASASHLLCLVVYREPRTTMLAKST